MVISFQNNSETASKLRQFEAKLARKFDTEDGLFCVSGVMAQNIVISVKNPTKASQTLFAMMIHPT